MSRMQLDPLLHAAVTREMERRYEDEMGELRNAAPARTVRVRVVQTFEETFHIDIPVPAGTLDDEVNEDNDELSELVESARVAYEGERQSACIDVSWRRD